MEIRTLRYFLQIARDGNITKAADYLHISQPTLSRQMQILEDELGKKLFHRHSHHISLTEEGMLLRERAEEILDMVDKTEEEFRTLGAEAGGRYQDRMRGIRGNVLFYARGKEPA